MNASNTNGPKVKINYIWVPNFRLTSFQSMLLMLPAILVGVIAFFPLKLLIGLLGYHPDDRNGLAVVSALLVWVAALFLIISEYRRRLLSVPGERTERLKRMLARDDACKRLSHRAVEFYLRQDIDARALTKKRLAALPSSLVIVNTRGSRSPRESLRSLLQFEPIDLNDADHLGQLTGELEIDPADSNLVRQRRLRFGIGYVLAYSALILLLPGLYQITRHEYRSGFALLAILAFLIGAFFLFPYFVERRCWLVPGGVALNVTRLWPRTDRLYLFRPSVQCLVLDARTGILITTYDGQRFDIRYPKSCTGAMLAGLVSTCPTPTLDEIKTFLGQPRETK